MHTRRRMQSFHWMSKKHLVRQISTDLGFNKQKLGLGLPAIPKKRICVCVGIGEGAKLMEE